MNPLSSFLRFLCIILFLSRAVTAQDILFDWNHVIGNGSENSGRCIAADSAGYVYVGGSIYDTIDFLGIQVACPEDNRAYLAKLTPDGEPVWIKLFEGAYGETTSICFDRNNNFYVCGTYMDSIAIDDTLLVTRNTNTMYLTNMFIAKFDVSGQLLWAKNTNGSWYTSGIGNGPLKKIAVDRDNNLVVAGRCLEEIEYFDTTATVTTIDSTWVDWPWPHWDVYHHTTGFLAKYTPEGQKLWVKEIGGTDCDPLAVEADHSGNIVVTGRFRNSVVFDSVTLTDLYTGEAFVAKYDSWGKIVWATNIGGTALATCNEIGFDSVSNVFLAGTMKGNNVMFDGSIAYEWSSGEGFLAKYDSAGVFLWVLPIGTSHIDYNNPTDNELLSLVVREDRVYVFGLLCKETLDFNGIILAAGAPNKSFILQLDLDGNVENAGLINMNYWAYPQQLILDASGSICIVECFQNNIFVGKIAPDFPVGKEHTWVAANIHEVYPNPSDGRFFVEGKKDKIHNLTLYDLSGKEIFRVQSSSGRDYIDVSPVVPKGVYILKYLDSEKTWFEKIIIE